jgi:hypothetical protein
VTTTPGRALFLLHEPGYFRLYGSTIVELARRGWQVLLAFDKPERRGDVALVPIGAASSVRAVGATPTVGREGVLPSLRFALDFLRYLEPQFGAAAFLRRRAAGRLPPSMQWLERLPGASRWVVGAAIRCVRALEAVVPADPRMREFLQGHAPDVVFVSPLVTLGPSGGAQTEAVKAARALGIPAIVGVASWDHLTSKGLIRVVPDALTVWNLAQRAEAVELHRIPPARVRVTGAQSLDHWFEPRSADVVARFRARVGLESGRRVILYVGSSKNMAPGDCEPRFVERWLAALRTAAPQAVREAHVLVRPHPANVEPWSGADTQAALGRLDAAVWPTSYSGMPLTDVEIADFRDTLLSCDAVVGVNTTAMIEAAIVGRPVLTVRDPAFAHSQQETLHFAHLAGEAGGCALVAGAFDEHVAQLERVLTNPNERREALAAFVRTFVRPCGLDQQATRWLCDAIESVALRQPGAHAGPALGETALADGRRRP